MWKKIDRKGIQKKGQARKLTNVTSLNLASINSAGRVNYRRYFTEERRRH